MEHELVKQDFREKISKMGVLVERDEVQKDVARRAARLCRFDERRYKELVKKEYSFEL